jgi:hypothetical protein
MLITAKDGMAIDGLMCLCFTRFLLGYLCDAERQPQGTQEHGLGING